MSNTIVWFDLAVKDLKVEPTSIINPLVKS